MTAKLAGKVRDSYLDLVREFPLTSIKDEKALKASQAMMDRIFARGRLQAAETAYLDALSDLVMAYESTHHSISAPSDAAMLQHLMHAKGVSQKELHDASGIPASTISEILSGRRGFAKGMVGTLASYFNVDRKLFVENF
jgi:HTH-type transcriptional regulator / antitoxin HigA